MFLLFKLIMVIIEGLANILKDIFFLYLTKSIIWCEVYIFRLYFLHPYLIYLYLNILILIKLYPYSIV